MDLITYALFKKYIDTSLTEYAKKNEVVETLPDNLVYEADLNNYATLDILNTSIEELKTRLNGVYHFKGSVDNLTAL